MRVGDLAQEFTIVEVTADPWRFQESMLRLADRGIPITEFPALRSLCHACHARR